MDLGSPGGFDVWFLPGFASREADDDGFQMQSAVQGKNAISARRSAGRAQRVMADFSLHGAAHLIPRWFDGLRVLPGVGWWWFFISV
jgi:hypothetical protein